jgi:hypothetical protein
MSGFDKKGLNPLHICTPFRIHEFPSIETFIIKNRNLLIPTEECKHILFTFFWITYQIAKSSSCLQTGIRKLKIVLRFCYVVFNSQLFWCSSLQMTLLLTFFYFTRGQYCTYVALSNAWGRLLCALSYSVDITTIWMRKVDVVCWILEQSWTTGN